MSEITTCILGAKNSGKSVFLANLLNQSKEKCILIDVLGVYNPRNDHKTAIIPNSYYCTDVDNYISNFDKFPSNAKIVIDVSGYIDDELIEVMDKLCNHLMEHKTRCGFMSDEIADIMPQDSKTSKGFHRLVKNGRNFGIKPVVIATQRPQSVNKKVFDLCDTFYVSSQKAPRTVEYILEILDASGDHEMRSRITRLKQREFLRFDGDVITDFKVPEYKYAFEQ